MLLLVVESQNALDQIRVQAQLLQNLSPNTAMEFCNRWFLLWHW
jgi:hypothetical protein